ncbi:riboflavin synthase [Methylocella sp.]|uniref:riboflavin synthase n=1 Tax=Methylocella sp. TaxID=1978226 RepID=UPI0037844DD2
MFTGIVTDVGRVLSVEERGALRRMRVACAYAPDTIALGASIACSGPCLTVVARGPEGEGAWFEVDVGAETLDKTSAGAWREGTRLNLERALKIGDELGGHIVTGHVDAVARIEKVEPFDGMSRFSIRVPREFVRFVAPKGSVALDGTSLTVNDVDGEAFSVLLIPHTLKVTTWGERKEGDPLNFEVDLMARYAARLAQTPA